MAPKASDTEWRKPAPGASEVGEADGTMSRRGHWMLSRRAGRLMTLTCLCLSVLLFNYAMKYEDLHARYEFRKLTETSLEAIDTRLGTVAQLLTGVAAFVGLDDRPAVDTFENYVAGLDLEQNFPEIFGVGFVQSVRAADVAALEQALSAQYGRAIEVHPPTPQDEKMVVTRMAPAARNEAVIGLNTGFETSRRTALLRARSDAGPALTARLNLVQDAERYSGFLMVQPVYARPGARFVGWVVAPFAGQRTLSDATASMEQDFTLRVYEGDAADADQLIYASADATAARGAVVKSYTIAHFGRRWHMEFVSTPLFDARFTSFFPHALLAAGLLLSGLLALALKSNALRSRALRLVAERRKRQLGAQADENRALLETSVLVVLVVDGRGVITFANEAACALFRCSCDALKGRRYDAAVTLLTEGDRSAGCNAHGRLADGTALLLDVQANSWRTAEGQVQTTMLIRDVTEQISAREQMETIHDRYDIALAGAGIGIFEIDLTTGTAQMSDTWHKILNTDGAEGKFDHQRDFLARVHPDDLPVLHEADRRCIVGETDRSRAEYRVRFGTDWRWMYSDAVPVERGPDGRATRLIGTQSDITDLRHARNALELSEARFRMVLEDAPVGMAVMDEGGGFLTVNAALSRLSGYDAEMLLGQMRLGDLLSRKDFVRMSRDVRALLKTGEVMTYQNQFRLCTDTSDTRWGLFNLSWTYDKNRNENVYIAQIVDITDQKKVEQIKSEFIATVSHELRTPLTSIKGSLGLLAATTDKIMGQSDKRLLEIARVNADRVTVIVNDILDLEKISSGEITFDLDTVDLHELLQHTISEMKVMAQEHQNTVQLSTGSQSLLVQTDPVRMRQVLVNLISNACKFSDPGTAVTVRCARVDEEAIVYVENTGPGVADEFRAKIFEAFTQADASDTRSKGGTGLGLNIARQIVGRLGGRIGFEQSKHRCVVFWFSCPLANADAVSALTPLPLAPRRAHILRALHVEDDRDFAAVIEAGFEGVADFVRAANLTEARALLGRAAWDVVLLDWTLPDGNAHALLDEIEMQHPQAKIISLSAANFAAPDPRIAACLIKSQVDIERIVEQVQHVVHAGGSIVERASGGSSS